MYRGPDKSFLRSQKAEKAQNFHFTSSNCG